MYGNMVFSYVFCCIPFRATFGNYEKGLIYAARPALPSQDGFCYIDLGYWTNSQFECNIMLLFSVLKREKGLHF